MLLALDTSAGTSVAIVDAGGGIRAERSTDDTMRHAEVIGGFLSDALDEAGVRPTELTAIAVGMGPGPFTGLRVGIAAARVFALGAGVRLLPVISHDAIALDRYEAGFAGRMLLVTDARRRELYWSRYDGLDERGVPRRLDGPGLAKPDALPATEGDSAERVDAHRVPAGALGILAQRMRQHDVPFAADEPLYLRSPDVTLSTRKRVS
ncbi:tRNA (adenosine(37)-N6)-threonylcarbamoyltransferase complex dimerization subunit type 1 TsaB [Homoserinimonas sp. OAct 916]|uniref:tRNA (adenosine(37)-N6)-threonylcarbamoyltransferase complex dimerization subunit type 1 TsaB n=1 Tax=Homoserinimonas sp. OAct 916 TaxID=2211450 RepID=UPI000DBE7474|nr:tRNA (adenosine(37)-N6)-threonylcarbamoyltransferase complex dimerization subunit type 1 TsaB [Homoserinimonas sp. OAct 916]